MGAIWPKYKRGAAADAYAAIVLASAGGDLSHERIERARDEAAMAMPAAWRRRKELAKRVEATRGQHMDLELVRDDLRELVALSMQCRAGVAAFGTSQHYDSAAAEPVANKVLIELREATLTYLARVRDAGGAPGYPEFAQGARKAAAETIEKVVCPSTQYCPPPNLWVACPCCAKRRLQHAKTKSHVDTQASPVRLSNLTLYEHLPPNPTTEPPVPCAGADRR